MNKKNNRKGFTTVELVIVIAVIAILATVLVPTFSGLVTKANDSAITQEARSALTVLLVNEDAQLDTSKYNYYVIYSKGDTTKWFTYNGGKLETATAVNNPTAVTGDTVYTKDGNAKVVTLPDGFTATAASDLSANIVIWKDKK